MSRHPRSPQRRIRRDDDDLRESSVHGYGSGRKRMNEGDRGYDSRSRDKGWDRDNKRPRRDDDRVPERDHRDYRERDRERERERDRDRYDRRTKDTEYGSSRNQRRSASPPSRTSRPRDMRSRSGSVGESSPVDKAKPNMAPSGLLAAETNTVKAVDGTSTVLKYNEPPEARKPVLGWRLYVFKDAEQVGEYC
jgi:smad nuclear-interacting protein 1